MDSQKVAGILGTIVAAIVLAAAFYFVPRNAQVAPAAPIEKAQLQKGPVVREIPNAEPVRGPVVREIPQ